MTTTTNNVSDFEKRKLSSRELAQMIDISAVQAFHTEQDVRALAVSAAEGGFIAAHALPHFVPLLRNLIAPGGATLVGGPVGFPSGGHSTAVKVAEARELAVAGADELDMMINLGRLKSGDTQYVKSEIRALAEAIAPIPLKVILEVGYLSDSEIARGCESIVEGGAAFVKTGTGWTTSVTTIEQIRLISQVVQGRVLIKASGGIRKLATISAMIAHGVSRFGINTRVALDLVKECAELPGGGLEIGSASAGSSA
jgi:deoxyribose-phosphate aldolase